MKTWWEKWTESWALSHTWSHFTGHFGALIYYMNYMHLRPLNRTLAASQKNKQISNMYSDCNISSPSLTKTIISLWPWTCTFATVPRHHLGSTVTALAKAHVRGKELKGMVVVFFLVGCFVIMGCFFFKGGKRAFLFLLKWRSMDLSPS